MKQILPILICCLTLAVSSSAQQTSLLSHYYYNPYLFNPAVTGQSRETKALLFYRQQWIGMPDAPQTQTLTIDGPLDERPVGIGMTISNDVTNIVGRFTAMMSASYTAKFSEDSDLSFGMSMGIIRNQIYFDKIRGDVQDAGLLLNAENRTVFDGNVGLSYRFKRFKAGVASEQVLNRSLSYQHPTDNRSIAFALVRHYIASFQYVLPLSEAVSLEPLVVLRSAQGLPIQVDANATVRVRNDFWANVAYRHDAGIGVALGTQVSDRFIIGYNYEVPTSDLRYTTGGSHEVMVGFRFLPRKEDSKAPRAINSRIVNDIRKENNAQYEKLDEISQKNETLNRELLEYKKVIEEQQREIERLKASMKSYDDELKQTVDKLKVDLQTEKTFDTGSTYYLVIGASKTLSEAKAFQKELKRETNLQPQIVQSESKTWFFIYSDELASPTEARQKLKNLENTGVERFLVGNPWIYKVKKGSK